MIYQVRPHYLVLFIYLHTTISHFTVNQQDERLCKYTILFLDIYKLDSHAAKLAPPDTLTLGRTV